MSEFTYHIDHDERGDFYAHVEDEGGNCIYSIPDSDAMYQMVYDGFMKYTKDVGGLCEYLQHIGLISKDDTLTFEGSHYE